MMSQSHIVLEKVSKIYPGVKALDHIDLEISQNKIYGLVGRNGAGKTTLLQLLAAQILPSEGKIYIEKENPIENSKILRKICLINENHCYPKGMTVKMIFDLCQEFYPNWDKNYAHYLAKCFDLDLKRKVDKLSLGMNSSLGIVIALASRAPITLMDEPYLGLDPTAKAIFYDLLLEEWSNHPRTIIISTHLVNELSLLFEKIIVIHHGRIVLTEYLDTIRNQYYYLSGRDEQVENFIKGKKIFEKRSISNNLTVSLYSEKPEELKIAKELGIQVENIPLQDIIVLLTKLKKE